MLRASLPAELTHLLGQDGYTLERVDVYGLIDGVHETVVIPGAECYVGRNDNPSFSPCGLSPFHRIAFHIPPPPPAFFSKFFLRVSRLQFQLVRSRSARFRILSGVP